MAHKLRAAFKQKMLLLISVVAIFIIFYMNSNVNSMQRKRRSGQKLLPKFLNISLPARGYLVWNNECQIPAVDPFLPEVMAKFDPEPPLQCKGKRPYVVKFYNSTTQRYTLWFNESTLTEYVDKRDMLECCYQKIWRATDSDSLTLADCLPFSDGFQVPLHIDSLVVRCRSIVTQADVYKEPFLLVQHRPDIVKRLENASSLYNNTKDFGVLVIGIDSISQMHLRRALPETLGFLERNEWYELSAYNKIEDNTYPNLMAILTGYDLHDTYKYCSPFERGGLDKCPFAWKDFRERGFVTAYGEDWSHGSTFNYGKKGFLKIPTDYYSFPFMRTAIDVFGTSDWHSNCWQTKPRAEYVYDLITEFSTRYSNHRAFGIFWLNSFSHDESNKASSMDGRTRDFLQRLKDHDVLDHFVVILCSDHGTRFGNIRQTTTGYYDERLPFFFMSLPKHLKESRPDFIYGLESNEHRLVSPYDIYMTLQHLLAVSTGGQYDESKRAKGCPTCQTILAPVPEPRNCQQAGITEHWCTCSPYTPVARYDETVKNLVRINVIDEMNDWLSNQPYGELCCPLKFYRIEMAYKRLDGKSNPTFYRSLFFVEGRESFTVTFSYDERTKKAEIDVPSISRLTTYRKTAACINDSIGKKYCICRKPGQNKQCDPEIRRTLNTNSSWKPLEKK